jgi:hypothetical protein
MRKHILIAACALILGLLTKTAAAHHSFGAEYDGNAPITLKGVITKIEWTNPHVHVYLDVKVFGWRARDGGNWAHSREVTFAGGSKLFLGPPAGTGDGGAAPAVKVP